MRKLIILLCLIPLQLNAARIAITIDDAPFEWGTYLSQMQRTSKIVSALDKHNIKGVFVFTNFSSDRDALKRLRLYDKSGHILANHTSVHSSLETSTAKQFINSIEEQEKYLKQFKNSRQFLRFPYSVSSVSDKKKESIVHEYILSSNYRSVPYTIDSLDWIYREVMQSKMNNHYVIRDWNALRDMYVSNLIGLIEKADSIKSTDHILLLHERDATSLFLSDFIERAKQRGHEFIPLITALNTLYRSGLLGDEDLTVELFKEEYAHLYGVYREKMRAELRQNFKKRTLSEKVAHYWKRLNYRISRL